jgi:hypothetical protein
MGSTLRGSRLCWIMGNSGGVSTHQLDNQKQSDRQVDGADLSVRNPSLRD